MLTLLPLGFLNVEDTGERGGLRTILYAPDSGGRRKLSVKYDHSR